MDAVEMLKEKARLTKKCTISCDDCRLDARHTDYELNCVGLSRMDPEKYIEIIEQWSKDCPKRTYLSKLLEIFPNAELDDEGKPPSICPSELGLKDLSCDHKCIDCWNQEYKE